MNAPGSTIGRTPVGRRTLLRSLAVLAAVALYGVPIQGDTVELVNGKRIETKQIRFKDGNLTLDDGRSISRRDVKRILFSRGSQKSAPGSEAGRSTVEELLRAASTAEAKYQDVGAIILIDDGDYTLREDGTQFERTRFAVKILKEDWKAAGEIAQYFEEGRERVTLVLARTITPDGTVHEFDPADLTESKPVEEAESFSQYRMVSGHLPGVEVGSIVETVWEREQYNPYDKELFFPNWSFGSTEPFVWSRITVRVPIAKKLFYRTRNMPDAAAKPDVTETDGQRVYRWEMRDVAHVVPEPNMPPLTQVVPSLRGSIHQDWDYLFDFLGAFQKEHISVTPAIEARVKEIIGDAATPEAKLAAIYHWMQREIRYVSIKGSLGSGWSGHPARLTLENGYGDCVDKAILFSTMLQVVGIPSYPVLLSTNDRPAVDRSLPTLEANHAINKIYLGDRALYLDSTAESFRYPYFRPDDYGVTTINVLERKIGYIDVPPPEDDAIDIDMDLSIGVQGDVEGEVTLHMTGGIEAGLREALEQINKMMLLMVARQAVNTISPGAELKNINVSDEADLGTPLTMKLQVRLPEYPSFAGDLMIFPLPLSEKIHQFPEASLAKRKFDIDYKSASKLSQHIHLHLPDHYVARGLPDPLSLTSPYVDYHASFSSDERTIVFDESFVLPKRIVPQRDYRVHRTILEKIANFARKPILLKKIKEDPT